MLASLAILALVLFGGLLVLIVFEFQRGRRLDRAHHALLRHRLRASLREFSRSRRPHS